MSAREMVVLGTASQVPTRYRNHNGYFLRWDGHGIVFDPGEGTQRQMVHYGVSASQINRILITHFHGDHCLGLAGLVQRISLDEVPHPVSVHYPASGQDYFDRLRHASIYLDRAIISECPIHAPGVICRETGFRLETLPLEHGVESWGYRLVEDDGVVMDPHRLNAAGVSGEAIGRLKREGSIQIAGRNVTLSDVSDPRPGQVVAFVMDTKLCDSAFALAEGADLLVCESTYLSEHETEAIERGHMTAAQAGRVASESGARRLVLTHFSQRYPELSAFVAEAQAFHDDVIAVSDGDVIKVPSRRGAV